MAHLSCLFTETSAEFWIHLFAVQIFPNMQGVVMYCILKSQSNFIKSFQLEIWLLIYPLSLCSFVFFLNLEFNDSSYTVIYYIGEGVYIGLSYHEWSRNIFEIVPMTVHKEKAHLTSSFFDLNPNILKNPMPCRTSLFLLVLQWWYIKVSHSSLETKDRKFEAYIVRQDNHQLPYF